MRRSDKREGYRVGGEVSEEAFTFPWIKKENKLSSVFLKNLTMNVYSSYKKRNNVFEKGK